jgi:tetratricopeptide (TPR) repeat protein
MSSADQLPALFGELERFVSQAEYDKALKMCDKILGIASDDQDALHCKLITLIRLEKYSDALALLSRKFKGENKFLFERAYCLYRSNQLAQALEVIETAKQYSQQDVATRHLEAQLVKVLRFGMSAVTSLLKRVFCLFFFFFRIIVLRTTLLASIFTDLFSMK